MRKTSHDGVDATSITSSIENEIKKAGANINKIKKSSIKRKVQNFSHESDDGIIEPLLKIDKDKSEIANRSAKYLLNKSKTDLNEKGNKSSDNYIDSGSISIVVSPTSKIANNTEKNKQISPSLSQETAPIHNHMNTNIFSTFDVSKNVIATKSPILVELDSSKPSAYSPNPLIFTTAKIHTDGTTKPLEPVHVTPVPILSTIEGNVVKTVTNNIVENSLLNIAKSKETLPNASLKSDANACQSIKAETLVSTSENMVSKSQMLASYLGESQSKNKKELQIISTLKDSTNVSTKSQCSNKINIPPTSKTSCMNIPTKPIKIEMTSENSTSLKTIGSLPINTQSLSATSKSALNTTSIPSKLPTSDKKKESMDMEKKDFSSKGQLPLNLQKTNDVSNKLKSPKDKPEEKQDNKALGNKLSSVHVDSNNQESTSILVEKTIASDLDKVKDTSNKGKFSSCSSKKLQRQKNAALEEIADKAVSKILLDERKDKTQDSDKKSLSDNKKHVLGKEDCQSTTPTTLIKNPTTIVSKASVVLDSTPKIKTPETNIPSLSKSGSVNVTKTSIATPVSVANETFKIIPSTSSIKSQPSGKISSTPSSKQEIPSLSQSFKSNSQIKYENPTVATTLPAYIVSTSKTKIGSTLTSNTITNTTKTLVQKPKNDAVYTPNETIKTAKSSEQSDKPNAGMPSSNGKQSSSSQQNKTKFDKNKKDGRA